MHIVAGGYGHNTMKTSTTSGAERRRERRYQVELPATVQGTRAGGAVLPVSVSDLSASGALISVDVAHAEYELGERIVLVVAEFGPIDAQVAHVGSQFYGLQFLTPHLHRDRLTAWLQLEANTGQAI